MIFTKTDFKEYLICSKWLWLKKKKPELAVEGEMSLFLQKLIKDGYEVEEFAQKLFPDGVELTGDLDTLKSKTKQLLEKRKTIFQATFETERELLAKIDVLQFDKESDRWNIYEIKASSSIKTDLKHNHLMDITFQTVVAEESGVPVNKSFIIHINKDYIRKGEIDPEELFIVEDVSEAVEEEKEKVKLEIKKALDLLSKDEISLEGCECLYRSHGQRCDSFDLFNPQVPEYSVHHIVGGKKLFSLVESDVFDVKEIPEDFELTDLQRQKVDLQKNGKALIDKEGIKEVLSNLTYPLYFLDYETFGKPYPVLDGYKSNQQIVFQYSLHVMDENQDVEHFEYLANDFEHATKGLVDSMSEHIGPTGSVVVWCQSFEKGRNCELAEFHPECADFLYGINSRIFDLMLIFKNNYLDPNFFGSASIKKVLPVMLPDLSYKSLEIQDGTMALSEWEKLIKDNLSEEQKKKVRENLLKYCELDTLAMVELFKKLLRL